jgi:hypothetical protein
MRQLQCAIVVALVVAWIAVFGYMFYLTKTLSATAVRPDPTTGRIYPRSLIKTSVVYLTHSELLFFASVWYLIFGLGVSAALLDARWKVFRNPSEGIPKKFY